MRTVPAWLEPVDVLREMPIVLPVHAISRGGSTFGASRQSSRLRLQRNVELGARSPCRAALFTSGFQAGPPRCPRRAPRRLSAEPPHPLRHARQRARSGRRPRLEPTPSASARSRRTRSRLAERLPVEGSGTELLGPELETSRRLSHSTSSPTRARASAALAGPLGECGQVDPVVGRRVLGVLPERRGAGWGWPSGRSGPRSGG